MYVCVCVCVFQFDQEINQQLRIQPWSQTQIIQTGFKVKSELFNTQSAGAAN
jgi:bacterioferritin-associated ferredoxin